MNLEIDRDTYYGKYYLDEKTADIHFLCGSELERIPAHKSVLCKNSDVFKSMFYGPMAEKGDVKLPEISAEIFKEFLKLSYYYNWLILFDNQFKFENLLELMNLTEMYLMPRQFQSCVSEWFNQMRWFTREKLDNIFVFYHYSLLFRSDRLKSAVEYCFEEWAQFIWKTSSFLECDHDVLDRILELKLREDESKIFEACLDWARRACEKNDVDPNDITNLRLQLKDSLFKIRYNLMNMTEFEEYIPTSKINALFPNPDDCTDVIHLLQGSKLSKTGHFITTKRIFVDITVLKKLIRFRTNYDSELPTHHSQ